MKATTLQLLRLSLKSPNLPPQPTLKAVAEAAALSAGNLSGWERGEKSLGARSLLTISALYGKTPEALEELFDRCRLAWLLEETAAVEARINLRSKLAREKGRKKSR